MGNPSSLLEKVGRPRILVVGDLMLDRYVWGCAERVSPEAPVLVLRSDRQELRLGGAASVGVLLRALDVEVVLAGVIGHDADGRALRRLLADDGIEASAVLIDNERPTTVKQRFLGSTFGRSGRGGQQILRVDYEVCEPLTAGLSRTLIDAIISKVSTCQAVLISDYDKGICSCELLSRVLDAARTWNVPILIDPTRTDDISKYRGASILVPNRIEAERATGLKIATPEEAGTAGDLLRLRCDCGAVVVKLDQDGIVLVRDACDPFVIPARTREVSDVTGAGDMVLAMLGLCVAGRIDLATAVLLANEAAGIEVERLGVVPVSREELRARMQHTEGWCDENEKVVARDEIATIVARYRSQGKRIVFTNGCFDLLHVGHVKCLKEAARQGDVLIVGINSDSSVRRLKGRSRPIVSQEDRSEVLAALADIDHVVIFDEDTPHALLHEIRPDVLVKGGTYRLDQVVGCDLVEAYGGRVMVVGEVLRRSTTRLVKRMACQTGVRDE